MPIRSDFTFKIIETNGQGPDIIKILDLNQGRMSVTNDIENVVACIGRGEQIEPRDYMILYRCTSGMWDGWNADTETYELLDTKDFEEAVSRYRAIRKARLERKTIFSQ